MGDERRDKPKGGKDSGDIMKKKHVIYMKNGNKIEIAEGKYKSFSDLLTRENPPQFISIDGNILSVSAISYCAIEDDRSW